MTTKKCLKFSEAWELLSAESQPGISSMGSSRSSEISSLPLKMIKKCEPVFQPRALEDGEASLSGNHVSNLVTALVSSSDKKLDPILVWWSGKHWMLVDGHHRLRAYKIAIQEKRIKEKEIPVEVFRGSLEEAWTESIRCNAKDKLAVSQDDKFNRAWKMVLMGVGSKSTQASSCGIGERTVANMRAKLIELKNKYGSHWEEVAFNRSWKEVLNDLTPSREINEDWEEKLAQQWADRLGMAFGDKFARQPDVAARALETYSEKLVGDLKAIWSTDQDLDF